MASWTIKGIRTVEGQPQTVNIAVVKDLELHDEWMAECYITVSVKSAEPIEFAVGDWIDYRGERYTIQYDPNVLKKARRGTYGEGFTYDNIKFVGLQDEVVRCDFNDVVLSDNDTHYTALPTFPFFCNDVDDLLDRIQANLEGLYPGSWIVIGLNTVRNNSRGTAVGRASAFYDAYKQYVDPTGAARTDPYGNQGIAESVDNITCWDALKKVHDDFDLNFIIRGRVIVVGTAGVFTANTFQYGKGNGLYEIERIGESDQRIVTRLRAYGSEDNLPSRYYADINLLPYGTNTAAGTGIANLDVDFNASYFTNEFESGQVAVVAKIGNTTYSNAVAYNNAETGKIIINTGTTDAISVDAKVYITDGVRRDMWPSDHRDIAQGALPDNMAVSRLMLPGFPNQSLDAWVTAHKNLTGYEWLLQAVNDGFTFSTDPHRPYIDSPNKDIYGIRPGNIYFDGSNDTENIHPTIEGLSPLDEVYAAEQISDNGVFDQGGEVPNFKITLPNLGFDLKKYYQDGASIDLKNGMCGARSFKMAGKPEQDENNRWVCDVEREYDQSLDLWFPYNDFQIHGSSVYGTGDKYALIGIYLPDAYIETAAVKLLQASIEALKKNHAPRYTYQPRIDEIWMQRQHDTAIASQGVASLHDTLKAGDIFSFADADLNINAGIIIDVLTIREHGNNGIPTYEITLRDEKQVGTIEKIANKVDSVFSAAVNGAIGGGGNGMTVSQIQSLINRFGDERYLSKLNDDTARGFITFLKGLQIGNAFTPGLLGEGGVLRKENDGKIYLELDKMYVRMKAYFDTVEIREYRHTEGNRVASVAGNKCVRVEWYNSSNEELEQTSANLSSVAYFRCFFRASDGDDTVRNNFVIGDQVYCHIVSVAGENDDPSQKGLNQKHYWRLCIGRNTEGNLTADGEAWIDVSNRSSETLVIGGTSYTHAGYQSGSDVPAPQDSMVQLGNINDTDRQGAIIEYVTGGDAPAYQIYQGINDFALTGKSMIFLGYNSQSGHADLKVYGDAYIGDRNQTTFIKYEQENATTHAPKLQIKAEVIFQNPENPSQTTTIQDFANAVTGDIADLQSQIDGEIDTWFYDYLPVDPDAVDPRAPLIWNDQAQTEPCHPYYDWYVADGGGTAEEVTTERTKHLGDIFYDNSTGYAFRFAFDELTGDFIWTEITDSAVIKALENAAKAQDTADSKRRVFVAQPAPVAPKNYVEYDVGDLWVNATYPSGYTGETDESQHKYKNDYLRCITAKPIRNAQGEITDGNFSINDWQLASKYTDDAKFNGYINQILNGTGATGDSATVANAIRAIKGALNEGTLIDGGLVLTSLIGLRSNNVLWSGISGQYDPWTETHAKGHGIAAWYGGGMVDIEDMSSSDYTTWKTAWDAMTDDQKAASSTVAKSLFRFDGSGYLATANITWNASGAVTIKNIISLTDTDNHNVSLNDLTKLTSIFHTETYGSGNVTELLINPQNAFSQLFINRTGTPVTNYPADLHTITDYSVLNFAEMKARFITVEFFEALFELHSGDTGNPKINANSDLSAYTSTQKALFNIKAMFGLWTEKYLSALGYNNSGGGSGGAGDVTWSALEDASDDRAISLAHIRTALSTALSGYATQTWVNAQNFATQTWVNNQSFVNWTALGDSTTTQQIALSHLTTALSTYATQNWVTSNFSTPSSVATQLQTYAKIQNGTITIGDTSLTPITSVTGTFWGKSFTNGGTVNGTIKAGSNGGAIEQFHSVEMNSAGTLSGYGGFIDFHYYASGSTFDSTLDYTSRIIESEVGVISILAKNNDATNANKLAGLLVGAGFDGSYIQIGDLRIVYDSTNNALKVVKIVSGSEVAANFYATGSVSALGYGSGGGGGTGDVTWTNLEDNSDDRPIAFSHIQSALSGYATTSQLAGYVPLNGSGTMTNPLKVEKNSNYASLQALIDGVVKMNLGYYHVLGYTFISNTTNYHEIRIYDNGDLTFNKYNGTGQFSAKIWNENNDGSGSGLDADLLDGQHGSYYATASALGSYLPLTGGTLTGKLSVSFNTGTYVTSPIEITNTYSAAYARGLDILFPNQGTTYYNTGLLFGRNHDTNNQGVINFGYRGDKSTSNFFGIGFYNNDNLLTVYANGDVTANRSLTINATYNANSAYNLTVGGHTYIGGQCYMTYTPAQYGQVLKITNNNADTWPRGISILFPNLAIGRYGSGLLFGQNETKNNQGVLAFYYAGDKSTSNAMSLGLFENDNLLYIEGTGNVGIGTTTPAHKLHVAGNIATAATDGSFVQIGGLRLVYDSTNTAFSVANSSGTATVGTFSNGLRVIAPSTSYNEGLVVKASTTGYSNIALIDDFTNGTVPTNGLYLSLNTLAITSSVPKFHFAVIDAGSIYRIGIPAKAGTMALTSDITTALASYVPIDGSVKMTGALKTSGVYPSLEAWHSNAQKMSVGYYPTGTYSYFSNTVIQREIRIDDSGNFTFASYASGASFNYKVWHEGNDGAGSGLDADLLDGQHATYFATAASLANYLPLTGGTINGSVGLTVNRSGSAGEVIKIEATEASYSCINYKSGTYNWSVGLNTSNIFYFYNSRSLSVLTNLDSYGKLTTVSALLNQSTLSETTGVLNINSTNGTGNFNYSIMCMSSELTATRRNAIAIGKAFSSKNCGIMAYYNAGNASDSNFLSFGFHSKDNVLNIFAGGGVTIGKNAVTAPSYTLDLTGTLGVTGNATVSYAAPSSSDAILYLTNTRAGVYNRGIDIQYPNISAGFVSPLLFGYNHDTNNQGVIDFGYAGDKSTSNYVGIGFYANDNIFKVYANKNAELAGKFTATYNGAQSYSVINAVNPYNGEWARGFSVTFTQQPKGKYASGYLFGQADGTNNKGVLAFYYADNLSTNNAITIGLYANDHIMCIKGTRNVGIDTVSPAYKLDVNGSFNASGDTLLGSNVSNTTTVYHKMVVGATNYTNSPYVQIGKIRFVYNDTDNAIRVVREDGTAANLYATGGISALGYQSGGGGGGSTGVFSTSITPDTTGTYDIGTSTYKWRNLYLAGANGGNGFSIITSYSSYVYIGSLNKILFGADVEFEDTAYVENRMGIGVKNGNYDLYVYGENEGNAYFAGDVSVASLTNRSDMRLKDVVGDVNLSVQQIASAPTFKFRFKEKAKRTMVGTSAQYWDAVLPESVTRDADGILGLDYGVTALVSTIILAKGMTEHERRIVKLEKENAELRARIKDLEEQ